MDKGKNLEGKFQRWCKSLDIYCQRFYDARSMGRAEAPSRPADFWLWYKRNLIFVECKETAGKSLAFSAFRPSQYKAAIEAEKQDIIYLALVSIKNTLYVLKLSRIIEYIATTDRKSAPLSFFKKNAYEMVKVYDFRWYLNRIIYKGFISKKPLKD